jgi:signal peptidase II
MPKPSYRRGEGVGRLLFPLTAALVLAADQITKLLMHSLLFPDKVIPLFGPVQLALVYNKGIAFGLFADQTYLSLAVFLALAVFVFFYRAHLFYGQLSRLSLGLLLGGAVGNLIDRLRLGHVVDFVDLGFWPVFNLADSAVTVGVFLLAYSLYSSARSQSRKD